MNWKRAAKIITAAVVASSLAVAPWEAALAEPVSEQVDGSRLEHRYVRVILDGRSAFSPSFSAVVIRGTTMVRGSLLDRFGYNVQWDPDAGSLTASRDNHEIRFYAGRASAEWNGASETLPLAPYIEEGMLWVPLRWAAERVGFHVYWDADRRTVTVRDPEALPRFSISTRMDAEAGGNPEALMQYMKRTSQLDFDLVLIPPNYFNEKTTVMIAAGDLSDLMLLGEPYMYSDELLRSIAADLTDWLDQYPGLQALVQSNSQAARSIDGRIYGIPRLTHPRDGVYPAVRQDWLDQLGLAHPSTMDEVYAVLQQFATMDPNGNGKADTFGLSGRLLGDVLGRLGWVEHVFTGAPSRFVVKGGELQDTALDQGERRALEWLARAYRDGLIDPNALTGNGTGIENSQAGIIAMSIGQAAAITGRENAEAWVPLPALRADAHSAPVSPWNLPGKGMYIIPRIVSPDWIPKLLGWLEHGLELTQSGRWAEADEFEDADRAMLINLFGTTELLSANPAVDQLSEKLRSDYEKATASWEAAPEPAATLAAFETVLRNPSHIMLNEQLEAMKRRVIVGEASLDEWDRYIETMKQSEAYQTMISELQALLQAES